MANRTTHMACKSENLKSAVQCMASGAKRRCYTDPNISQHLRGSSKTSFKAQSPNNSSHCYSGGSAGSSASTGGSQSPSGSQKRKSSDNETEESQRKRSRYSLTNSAELEILSIFADDASPFPSISSCPEPERSLSTKRPSEEEEEGPRKRTKLSHDPSDSPSSNDGSDTSSIDSHDDPDPKNIFEAKYAEGALLGEGGYGSVYAGIRLKDNLPVAIKHTKNHVKWEVMRQGKENILVPREVAFMLKLKPAEGETSFAIQLLDWYEIDEEIILVLERPVPCSDMLNYLVRIKKWIVPEHEAQAITKQLLDAIIEIHSKGVFHNDLKIENVLIETGSDVPRVRLIDFGCSTFFKEEVYRTPQGTREYSSPEWFTHGQYRAEPATVWQLGVTLFLLLHVSLPFNTTNEILNQSPNLKERLSKDCKSFLLSCLDKLPKNRPSLEALKNHPWLNPSTQDGSPI